MHSVTDLLNQYGYIVLYVSLLLELIAFPLPGEALMTYCGVIVGQHKLNWGLSILVAMAGVMTGITISYFVGRAFGSTILKKYGHYVHLGPDKMEKTAVWFDKYGDKLLIFAYFIPGVRHITGYFSGISGVSFKKFAIYAYTGAIVWTATFISLGKILGENWKKYGGRISRYLVIFIVILILILALKYFYQKYEDLLLSAITSKIQNSLRFFHSFRRVKFVIAATAVVFILLMGLVIGGIQDLLANEFGKFDETTSYLIQAIFSEKDAGMMNVMNLFSTYPAFLLAAVATIFFIWKKGKYKFLEIRFILIAIVGGQVLQVLLRLIFRRIAPFGFVSEGYSFPSKTTFMSVAVYGFICFLLLGYLKKSWARVLAVVLSVAICLFCGLGALYNQTQFPSDIYAGYIFGGVWLTLNMILLEVNKIITVMRSISE